jgi:hypothetical protein
MNSSQTVAPLVVALLMSSGLAAGIRQEGKDEGDKKKDKESVELVVTGCLKGRALQAEEVKPATESEETPVIQARTFRVNGTKAVLDEVKKQNNRYVEATGRVKRSALMAGGPGISVGGARITVTPGSMGDPSRAPQYDANAGVLHIDVTAVRVLAENCSLK